MKKLSIITIILALLATGVYFFIKKQIPDLPTCADGFRLDFGTRDCVPANQRGTERNVDFTKVSIKIPDSKVVVTLSREERDDQYAATFQDPSDPVIKGFVSLDSSKVTRVSDTNVLVPFYVNFGGTGQFLYVGSFDAEKNEHVASVFVGDRVAVESIDVADPIIKVNYKTRLDTEGMAAEPTIPAQLVLEINNATLQEIMRLQNADYADVELKSPAPNSTVSGDFSIKGAIPGPWYFEAVAPYRIMSAEYEQIALGSVQALSDWMTTQRVPFEVKLNTATLNYKGKATLIISSENVAGDETGERRLKKMEIPVTFK